jgi:hypothetical protein
MHIPTGKTRGRDSFLLLCSGCRCNRCVVDVISRICNGICMKVELSATATLRCAVLGKAYLLAGSVIAAMEHRIITDYTNVRTDNSHVKVFVRARPPEDEHAATDFVQVWDAQTTALNSLLISNLTPRSSLINRRRYLCETPATRIRTTASMRSCSIK